MNRLRGYVVLVATLLVVAWCASAFAQNAPVSPKYDVAAETKLKGTVEEIKQIETAKGTPAIHLMVKSGEQLLEVYLCPNAFLQEMQMAFAKGDEVEVIGSKVKADQTDVILAREITKGTDTLVLRDKKGNPVWTPVRRG